MSKKKKPPIGVLMFAGVWTAAASVSCMEEKTCTGVAFCAIFAFLSVTAFLELDYRIKEQGR